MENNFDLFLSPGCLTRISRRITNRMVENQSLFFFFHKSPLIIRTIRTHSNKINLTKYIIIHKQKISLDHLSSVIFLFLSPISGFQEIQFLDFPAAFH